jgi:hypothetical protein
MHQEELINILHLYQNKKNNFYIYTIKFLKNQVEAILKALNMEFEKRNDEVFSKAIKAGKRTYFIDIKTTKGNELYLTLTESKKVTEDGREFFQKHKIFLYKEDFQKFKEGLDEVMDKLSELNETGEYRTDGYTRSESKEPPFTFESL